MEKLSIFGSTGFIGSNFCKLYSEISYLEPRDSEIPKYDNILYCLGTNNNYSIFSENPAIDYEVNVIKLIKTLHNCKNRNINITYLSSWFVYNGTKDLLCSENSNSYPLGYYSSSKLAAELVLTTFCQTYDKKFKILRLANIIGGDKNAGPKKNILEHYIQKLKNNEDIEIYGDSYYRNYLGIEDCCRAIKLIMDKGNNNEIYNIGATHSIRKFIDLIGYCKEKLNSKSKIKIVPNTNLNTQIKDFWMNTDKIKKIRFQSSFIYETLDKLCENN